MEEQPSTVIKKLVGDRWDLVFGRLAPELDKAMERAPRHVPCPVHDSNDGFRLFKDWKQTGGGICSTCGPKSDGIKLFAWVKGLEYTEALKILLQDLGGAGASIPPPRVKTAREIHAEEARQYESDRKAVASIRRAWNESFALDQPMAEPARLYFARRGLSLWRDPRLVRFNPTMAYYDQDLERVTGYHPTLLFRVVDAFGRSVTLHRIYLDREGRKAKVAMPKKTMSYPEGCRSLSGGAIRFVQPGPCLGLAEGPETALAVIEATGMPVWATMSNTLLQAVQVPRWVQRVVLWLDKDRSEAGKKSGQVLCERLWSEKKAAGGYMPTLAIAEGQSSVDWLDVWNQLGAAGFPATERRQQPVRRAGGA